MTASILIDSNVLIDVSRPDSPHHRWARDQIAAAADAGTAVINPLVYAEVAAIFHSKQDLDRFLPPASFRREPLPWDAALPASRAFLLYRRRGGTRTSPLPDFYIGAHAEVAGLRLLTRDAQRFATYFPGVPLVSPPAAG